jgi:regulatory protein
MASHDPDTASQSRTSKQPPGKPATRERLEAAGLAYLARFQTSAGRLRQVLMRRVRRSASFHGTDAEAGREIVDTLVARWQQSGLLDDRAFAEARAASLGRRGTPGRRIAAKLAEMGVDEEDVAAALASSPHGEKRDLAAALALARRRRLGPYRAEELRAQHRQKDLMSFARAGFDRRTAERVLDAESPEAIEALLQDGDV